MPSWLRGTKTITGYVAGIDPGKLLVRTLETGNVLCKTDAQTKVHVDKTVMSLDDLKDGDPIAVRLKEVKNQGPYAVEIMPHPDVLRRKEKGPEAPPAATELPATPLPPASTDTTEPAPTLKRTVAAPTQADRSFAVPVLPRGQSGLTGTIVALSGDDAQLETTSGEKRAVLVTSVTRIVKNGTRDELMERIQVGDRVAIMGDAVDSGVYIAREILVNRAKDAEVQQAAAPVEAATPAKSAEPLKGDFTAIVDSVENDVIHMHQADGRKRNVVVTPITTIKKWNSDVPLQGLRKGDELKITGDVLDDGQTLAREITVTKAAPSR